MTAKLTSADIKQQLTLTTGVEASLWSRWSKYKVGSASDMKPPKDSSQGFCKGLKFAEKYPHLEGAWVRLYGAPSDQPVTAVAVFDRDGIVLDILDIGTATWASIAGTDCQEQPAQSVSAQPDKKPKKAKKAKIIHYNVVTQIGYVESSRPSMLWWSHAGEKGKTGEQLAEELRGLFIEFYSSDFTQKSCCEGKKPTKKSRYCDTCGSRLGSKAGVHSDRHQDCVENAIIDLHVGSCDSIMGDCRRNDG